jgi:hypothetical protein
MLAAMVFALAVNFCIAIFIICDVRKYHAGRNKKRIRADMSMFAKRKRGFMRWRYS